MMQSLNNEKVNVEFGIEGIQILQFSLDNSSGHQSLETNYPYTFQINSGVLFDSANKLIAIDFNIIIYTSKEKKDKVCELTVRVSFNVVNYDQVVVEKDNSVTIPDSFIHHIIAVTLSTSRGILFEKLQGSFLSNMVLPLFDVTQFQKVENE